ncbi:MAG: transcriptional repressor [Clostridiales bacterium]|jgi:Fur family ferric uptake transcriptional regulator|nr:transcriptional repressor [Clostridiales bacterium]
MKIRNTRQRQLILDAVKSLHAKHPTAEEIYSHIESVNPGIGRATVYRNLSFLSEAGHILKIETPIPPDRFDDTLAPHYHMQCRVCGEICDADIEYMRDIESRVKPTDGFIIESHDITFKGICRKCHENIVREDNAE